MTKVDSTRATALEFAFRMVLAPESDVKQVLAIAEAFECYLSGPVADVDPGRIDLLPNIDRDIGHGQGCSYCERLFMRRSLGFQD